ncbi:MAG: stc2 [Clostridiaceae bacterium]|jgi:transcriptional regulator with PAS, ATPase and Fis domain|nr:stc2 [Clostridiaceae bacterium]MDF2948600.1 stc2 [Sedimentibacter sp.]
MDKKIVLIAGSVNTKEFLYKQIKEFVPDSYILEAYSQEEGIINNFKCDLMVVSSKEMMEELKDMQLNHEYNDIVVCERSVNFDIIDQVANIPVNEEVLLVNDEKETAISSINDLKELGLNHIIYYPYYPSINNYKKLKTAITPGEPDKVPSCVENIINLGPRIININSLYAIMDKLNLSHKDTTFITKKYMQKIINVSMRISAINNNVNALNGYLNNIIHNLVNGILVFDENGYIKYANEIMRKLLLTEKELENKNIRNIIDRELYPYFLSKDTFDNKKLNIMGTIVKVNKFITPVGKDIVITTDHNELKENKKLPNYDYLIKGHVARHNFENIIGSSTLLKEIKNTAIKLAKTDLTVLIEGESGTGKELFASAIHQNSKRNKGPYIAINFSALPDELIESELFGYEEGAFTGAKKGGKIGLFELAEGGTIFLDEIGDVSPKLQTKLLRVLQEKEIMMLGGTSIKKVDVRIIAATNKNLKNMVLEKQFRSDLYYRLKIGYLYIPPLRERLNDIVELVSYFIKIDSTADVKVRQEVIDEFMKYKWHGNVRELESTIQYMLAVRTGSELTMSDLPDSNFFEHSLDSHNMKQFKCLSSVQIALLKCINELQFNNISAGRENLSLKLKEEGLDMTSSQVRTRLDSLEKQGYIIKKRGRQGTFLTDLGYKEINSVKD